MARVKRGVAAKRRHKKVLEQAMRQHLFEKKPSTRTRRLAADADVHSGDLKKIKRLLAER